MIWYNEKLKRAYTIIPIYSSTRETCKPAHFSKYFQDMGDFQKGASDWKESLAAFDKPYNFFNFDELDVHTIPMGTAHVKTFYGCGVSSCTVYRFWEDNDTCFVLIDGILGESYKMDTAPEGVLYLCDTYKTSPGRYKELQIICSKEALATVRFNTGFLFAPVWKSVKELLKEERNGTL